jgi:hypothetical protein
VLMAHEMVVRVMGETTAVGEPSRMWAEKDQRDVRHRAQKSGE